MVTHVKYILASTRWNEFYSSVVGANSTIWLTLVGPAQAGFEILGLGQPPSHF